jgi:AcrR family transcriptional regulator
MFIQIRTRKYTQRQRAEDVRHTRERIVDATMLLHEELGPRKTTISAIAERAGVQRLTVYRHFAADEALFRACSSRWFELHAPPDPASWIEIDGGRERSLTALLALYGYYRSTESMWCSVYRDADVAAMAAPLADFHTFLDSIADGLVAGWQPRGRKSPALKATLRHALEFETWRSLAGHGLGERKAAELVTRWAAAALAR